jgi:FkbM family methyltransferase
MDIEKTVIAHVGAEMYYRPDISVGRMLKHTGIWEEPTVKYLMDIKKKDRMYLTFDFLDIGAHWGYYSVIVNTLWPQAKIHAFEPFGENLEVLHKNLDGISNATIHPYGIGRKSDSIPYWVGTMESGRGTFLKDNTGEIKERDPELREFILPIKPLEEADFIWQNIGLVKIDTQGMECDVLKQVLEKIGHNSCWIIIENNKEVSSFIRTANSVPDIATLFPIADLLPDNNWVLMKAGGGVSWQKPS